MVDWIAYRELAWAETILSPPEDDADETASFVSAINQHASEPVKTLLHLGCGGGINDFTFKKHYQVTGIDVNEPMLAVARQLNPEVTYQIGDMRTIELNQQFDAVAIPDSIMHLLTVDDLRQAMATVGRHLRPGGLLLLVMHAREDFQENNFVYTGCRDEIEITLFENNYVVKPAGDVWEATVVYLIRRQGELEIHSGRCRGGLFPLATWHTLFEQAGLEVLQETLSDDTYDRFLMNQGKYRLRRFVCRYSGQSSHPA